MFAELPDRDGLFLDVGASSGSSAMSFRLFQRRSPILSIEPNPVLERDLRFLRRILTRFDYRLLAAGDRRGAVDLYVPTYCGVPITAESSLAREAVMESPSLRRLLGPRMSSEYFSISRHTVEMRPLDDLELEPAVVKIDVQGSELSVLRGLRTTIERHRPVLLLEKSHEFQEVCRFLAERRYQAFVYVAGDKRLEPYRDDASAWNVFFLPDASGP